MKIFKILIFAAFVLVISACHNKNKTIYDYPDDDNSAFGEIGDPCTKNGDCKSGLVCIDKVCSEPAADQDMTDDADTQPDGNEPTDDADSDSRPDEDKDSSDTEPTDDTDTGITDEDEPEDTDTQPDEDPYVPECGNGIRDEGEECDNGLENSDEPGILGITCRTNCTLAFCGDNITDSGELCDDGNNADGDYCRSDCQGITGYCGDGIEQWNEQCDRRNNPYCSEDCQTKLGECGDGIKQSFEVCDKATPDVGNHEGIGTYCSEDCKKREHTCGDGTYQPDMEVCDDGANNGKYGYCNANCTDYAPYCGDGILHRSNCNGYGENCIVIEGASEVCDDGNNNDGDYCSADCKTSFGSCGDGTIQEGLETCDKAKSGVGEGQGIGIYCSDDCQTKFGECGDAILNQDGNGNQLEQCDYGKNGENGPVPNGNLDCPYGSFAQCERCTLDCKKVNGKITFCGDRERQPVEACDNGDDNGKTDCAYGETSCKVCSTDCQNESNGKTSFCGDGEIDTLNGEVCDTQKTDDPNTPYCSADCKHIVGRCGDGLPNGNGNEECDNGETGTNPNGNTKCAYGETSCTVCTLDCKIAAGTETSYCGNGGIDGSNGEICDDRENNGKYSPYATSSSTAYCNSDCKGRGEGGFCGDGTLQRATCSGFDNCTAAEGAAEECDNGKEGTNPNGNTKCAYGEISCTVCTNSCKQTAGTETSYCGDGKVDRANGEVCDDGNNADGDYCSADCRTSFGFCGDGIRNKDSNGNWLEACDKAEPNIGNHEGIGAYCSDDCQTKLGECGDGIRNQDSNGNWIEACDDGANNGKYSPDANNLYCNEDCQGRGQGGYCGDGTWQENEEACEHGGDIQIYCPYGQDNCQVCSSDCTLKAGKTAYCNDGTLQRADCTGYEDKGCVVTPNAEETCDDGADNGRYGGFCNAECKGKTPYCNDGILQRTDCTGYDNCVTFEGADEDCDDGENNGKYKHDAPGYCDSGCKGRGTAGYCGDGVWQQSNESCDNGANNGRYGFCNDDCSGDSPKCGDAILQRADCTGYEDKDCVVFAGANEECDEGSFNSQYDHCNANCSAQLNCGDGILQRADCTGYEDKGCVVLEGAEEECDDGEENGGYAKCNSTCTGHNEAGSCGDGILQREDCTNYENCVETPGANEKCDSGENNGKYLLEAPGYCNTECDGFAEGGTCNDGIIQRADCTGFDICDENITENCCVVTEGADENCDDGTLNGQYESCNSTCSGRSYCGDGVIDELHGETCDDGFANGMYGNNCDENCGGYTGYCDDGIIQRPNCEGYGENCVVTLDANEECDDNGYNNGTYGHCDDECRGMRPERCGDGIIQREDCEGYAANCEVVPGAHENCDDGDDDNGSFGHCDTRCEVVINYRCGDGKIQKDRIEDCAGMDLCDENITENCCEVVVFALGDEPEVCDDGAQNNTKEHCNSTCSGMTPYCGDGIIQRSDCTGYDNCRVVEGMTEECDEGGNNNYYGHCNNECTGIRPERCGDGILQTEDCTDYDNCHKDPITNETVCPNKDNCEVVPGAYEYCDEGDDNGKYFGHCDDKCSNTTWNGYCGDGAVQKATEAECDAFIAANGTDTKCKVVSFKPGDPSELCDEGEKNNGYHGHCNTTCSGTSSCGDGVVGKDEVCEPGTIDEPWPCYMLGQFREDAVGTISECDSECMPLLTECTYTTSYTSPFFETGQTKRYNNSEELLTIPDESDNFYGQEPDFNYTAHEFATIAEGVVKENVSGLMWQADTPEYYGFEKDKDYIVYSCALPGACTLNEARTYCSDSYIGGYNNWRLPTVSELTTIVDYSDSNHIYSDFFTRTDGYYWTKEGLLFSSDDGTFGVASPDTSAEIKCVRSKDAHCPICNHEFTVMDSTHVLITALNEEDFIFWYFDTAASSLTWEEALVFCKELGNDISNNNNGIKEMRLPTVNELISLYDGENGISLIPGFSRRAWTSTTLNTIPADKAYVVDFSNGSIVTDTKTNNTNNTVICVE